MIAQRVQESGAWLNLNVSRGAVDVENDLYISRECRWCRLLFLSFGFGPKVIGNSGAGAGDTDSLEKLASA